jgi:hypothetical protein
VSRQQTSELEAKPVDRTGRCWRFACVGGGREL